MGSNRARRVLAAVFLSSFLLVPVPAGAHHKCPPRCLTPTPTPTPTPLMVDLTAPADGSTVTAGTVTLEASASGAAWVEFWADGTKLGTDSTAPYSQSWAAVVGAHQVAAVANDGQGVDSVWDGHRVADTHSLTVVDSDPGTVLWDSNLQSGTLNAYASSYRADRGSVVDDPVLGSGRKVAKLVSDPSVLDGSNIRVQFTSPSIIPLDGSDVWIGEAMLFPADFPSTPSVAGWTWADLGDVHGPPFTTPCCMMQWSPLAPGDGRTRLGWPRTSPYADWGWVGPYIDDVKGRWVDIVLHLRYTTDPSAGLVEIWTDTGSGYIKQTLTGGQTTLRMQTLVSGDAGGPNYHKISHYWPSDNWGSRTVTSYFAEHRIGTSFAAIAPHSYSGHALSIEEVQG